MRETSLNHELESVLFIIIIIIIMIINVMLELMVLMVGLIPVGYESLTGKLVKLLERLKNREVSPDYTYYGIASPWLQVCTCHRRKTVFGGCVCVSRNT